MKFVVYRAKINKTNATQTEVFDRFAGSAKTDMGGGILI